MTTFWKGLLAFVAAILTAWIGGLAVEWTKGTPLTTWTSILLWPFRTFWSLVIETFAWLNAPAQLTHLHVLLFAAVLLGTIIRGRREFRLHDQWRRHDYVDLNQRLLKIERPGWQGPKDKVADGFKPTRLQKLAARALLQVYPRKLLLPDLASRMADADDADPELMPLSQGQVASEMEALEQAGVAQIADPDTTEAYYGLTRHGRDFMLRQPDS